MNWLQNIQFEVHIDRLPSLSFRTSKVNIPGIDGQGPTKPTPFNRLPFTPDSLTYSPLSVTCGLDEELRIWEEMYNWMIMGFPENHKQFSEARYESSHYSDITVIMLNNKKNPIGSFIFKNSIPINIGPINLDSTQTETQVVDFTVDFTYDTFSLVR